MKKILYMATTINGYIAKEKGETPWSSEEWKNFSKIIKKSKNIIIGRKTYYLMKKNKEFSKLNNPRIIVLSKESAIKNSKITITKNPKEAIKILEKEGFKEAIIAGGSITNSSFMKEKLIDEIYLDIEPLIFGKGIKLFFEGKFEEKLKLIKIKKLSKNLIHLRYKILYLQE